jgi:flagellin-like protein
MLKGISPIVAAVLLIAVAISVGVLATTWVRNWVMEQTQQELLSCVLDTEYHVSDVEYNTTSKLMKAKITNKNSRKLYSFGVVIDNGTTQLEVAYNSSNITLSPNITSANKLDRERSVYLTLNLTDYTSYSTIGSSATKVIITNQVCTAVTASSTTITQKS